MKTLYASIIICVCLLLGGCTQYNGHIGPIFGSWSLVGIAEDGEELPLDGETVFSFQNEIVQVLKLGEPPQVQLMRFGNFKISDDELTMTFQAGPTASGNYIYVIPHWLYFPLTGEPLRFEVRKLSGSEMTLILDTGARKLVYSLTKTW